MKGLSITAIGLRSFGECMDIFHTLKSPLELDYLELAIGSKCELDSQYQDLPLILHDSCLYDRYLRCRLDPLQSRTWKPYITFIANHNVLAVSLHPPLKRYCSQQELEAAMNRLQQTLQVPVYLEVMPSSEYWCSSLQSLIDFPLLLDVSHVNIWHHGDESTAQTTCLQLLNSFTVGAIHLSHNRGKADTHDLIPRNVWFSDYIDVWCDRYLVTYESLPVDYAFYERLDKCRKFELYSQVKI
ncbi:MAG: hypothetical protein AAGF83_20020 [Cyanobacteria bacterium P01_G01_bin.67]